MVPGPIKCEEIISPKQLLVEKRSGHPKQQQSVLLNSAPHALMSDIATKTMQEQYMMVSNTRLSTGDGGAL